METGNGEFVTALTSIKTAFDLLRSAERGFEEKKPDLDEVNRHLSEVHETLVNAREALADAQEENRTLKARADRRKEMETDKYWEKAGGFYRRKSEIDAGLFIPYCPLLLDSRRQCCANGRNAGAWCI